ncbi:hypothetical protein B296_00022575 [Ensete ventricosum]|uniref:Uncharacterized protein n=1 Tax=Ensete ventricosum TaxID=4639 RepID=A0A426YP64_ENSVE|nr:hypothetical protein B296_00022575 [Ensete ventricosum]
MVRRRQQRVTVVRIATTDGRRQQASDKGYDSGWQGWLGGAGGSNNSDARSAGRSKGERRGLCAGRVAAKGAAAAVIEEGGRGWWLMEKGSGWLQLRRLRQRETEARLGAAGCSRRSRMGRGRGSSGGKDGRGEDSCSRVAAVAVVGMAGGDEEVGRNRGGRRRKKQPRERKKAVASV